MLTVALVGVTGYAGIHLRTLEQLAAAGRVRLVAAVAINRVQALDACARVAVLGARLYEDFDSMLADWSGRVDVICLPTPIHLHASMTEAALAAGAHVLVEKPLAATLAEVDRIARAAEAARRFVGVGFQDLSLPEAMRVKRLVLTGALGARPAIKVGALWPRDRAYFARNDWAGRIAVGAGQVHDSPVSNALAHFLNLALFWAGEDEEVSASPVAVEAEVFRAQAIENFDTVAARFSVSGGREILFLGSHSCLEEREARVVVEGTAGRVTWRNGHEVVIEVAGRPTETLPLPRPGRYVTSLWQAMLGRIEGRDDGFICPVEVARAHAAAVALVAAAGAPKSVPREFLRAAPERVTILGLEEIFDRAWERSRLFSELGAPWASGVSAAPAALALGRGGSR